MKVVILSDIFGRTQALETLALAISPASIIIDPYKGEKLCFDNEQIAYECFSEQVGLNTYSQVLDDYLATQEGQILLIGFSIGASAIWRAANGKQTSKVKAAYGFYGSQIRHETHIQASFPIELTFPAFETHFCVDKLIEKISTQDKVTIRKSQYMHGFMNQLSTNYSPEGYQKELEYLQTRAC